MGTSRWAPHSHQHLGRRTAPGNSTQMSRLLGPCTWPASIPQKEQRQSHLSSKPEVEPPPEEDPCLRKERVTCAGSQLSSHPARLGLSSAQRPESCPPAAQGGLRWTGQQVQVAGIEAPWSNGDILRNHGLSRAGPPHAGQLGSPRGPRCSTIFDDKLRLPGTQFAVNVHCFCLDAQEPLGQERERLHGSGFWSKAGAGLSSHVLSAASGPV